MKSKEKKLYIYSKKKMKKKGTKLLHTLHKKKIKKKNIYIKWT